MPHACIRSLRAPSARPAARVQRARSIARWVKLAGADRITRASGNLRDAIAFIRALAQAAPQRLVWGSDWPNIGFHSRQQVHDDSVLAHRELDAGELLDVLLEAVPDSETRSAILSRNPEALYGFSTSS